MPALSLVCPHCERPVEVQVTSVTRSRPCPECGEMLMLQVAEKTKKAKRRALLMGSAVPQPPAETTLQIPSRTPLPPDPKLDTASARIPSVASAPATSAAGGNAPEAITEKSDSLTSYQARLPNFVPSHEPHALPGAAFERMRMDPEIQAFRKRLIIGAGVVLGCILVAVVIRPLSSWYMPQVKQTATKPPQAVSMLTMIEEEPKTALIPEGSLVFKATGKQDESRAQRVESSQGPVSNQLSMDLTLSLEALRKFLAAPNWKQRMAWSRSVKSLEQRMAAFYAQNADGPVMHDNIVESKESKGGLFEHIVVLEGGGRRTAFVEKTSQGPRVDWAAFVGAGDLGWAEFMEKRPIQAVTMRVMVTDGFHYENQFGSPRLLKCLDLRCISEPGAPVIHAYIERDSTAAIQLEFWLKQSEGTALPLTLMLKYPLNAPSSNQVWVAGIVRQGWQDT